MTIKKVNGGYKLYAKTGSRAGQALSKKPMSKEKVLAQERAIEISKHAKSKK